MVMERAMVISDIYWVLAHDPKPTESYSLSELTVEVNKRGHNLTAVQMLGYLFHERKGGHIRIDAVGKEGEPHIHLTPAFLESSRLKQAVQ
jgi:hypothetical protein